MNCGCGTKKPNNYTDSSYIYRSELDAETELWAMCGADYKEVHDRNAKRSETAILFGMYKYIAPTYDEAVEIAKGKARLAGYPCLVRYYSDLKEGVVNMLFAVGSGEESDPLLMNSEMDEMVGHDKIVFEEGGLIHEFTLPETLVYILERMSTTEEMEKKIDKLFSEYKDADMSKYDDMLSLILGETAVGDVYPNLSLIYQIKRNIGRLLDNIDGKFEDYVEDIEGLVLSNEKFNINLSSNSEEYGKVYGSGTYKRGDAFSIYAVPNASYKFVGWSDGDMNEVRPIVVTKDETLVANFEQL